MGPPTVHLPLAFQLGQGALKSGAQELRTAEDPTPVSRRRIRTDLQKDQTCLPFSINLTTGADRKLPLPAAFGSCPQYRCTRRSTDPNQGHEVSTQKTGQAGSRQRASARCAACRRTPEMPFSSTGPISVKVTSTPAEASTTSCVTRTSPGRAYSAIREARFTVRP
jgi:hypothetical protein